MVRPAPNLLCFLRRPHRGPVRRRARTGARKTRSPALIVTTTANVDGREVEEYLGIVFGEVITGINVLRDIGAGLRNFFGGRSEGYEQELLSARQQALQEMEQRAAERGADAILGVDMDYEVLGADGSMLMVTASGTAVRLR